MTRGDVRAPFAWRETPFGPALVSRMLEPLAPHLFTTRGWQLGRFRPGTAEAVAGWHEVAAALGLEDEALARARQVHGVTVCVADGRSAAAPAADIVVADGAFGAAIQTADCAPILIASSTGHVVVAAHAGWRGLAAGVPRVAVEALVERSGEDPAGFVAAVGPAIGPCCYEVGGDVREGFLAAGFAEDAIAPWFLAEARGTPDNPSLPGLPALARAGRWYFDVWRSARDALRAAGMREDRIDVAGICTASHPSTLCSYRRDGVGAGRLGAAIRPATDRP